MLFRYQTLVFDVETDGLLPQLTKIHVLHIHEVETGESWTYRNNDKMNNIAKGLKKLSSAKTLVGHNILHFDLKAIEKVYPDWTFIGTVRDTLPMSRMIFANIKDKDFRLWYAGKIEGKFIGLHSLDSWGARLGLHKGDYKKVMEEQGLDPWAEWNQEMEDYCVNDVNINVLLWLKLLKEGWDDRPIIFEHTIHDLVGVQEENGFPFDMDGAHVLWEDLESHAQKHEATAKEHYGIWWAPEKKWIVAPVFQDPKRAWKKKKYKSPRQHFGEDESRAVWAEVKVPKATRNAKTLWIKDKKTGGVKLNFSYDVEAPFCPVVCKEFNPASRPQIVDRFTTVYQWEPNYEEEDDWTDAGAPRVSDGILRGLIDKIPMAEEIAEIFYYRKRIGQLATGANAWIKKAVWNEDAQMYFIHHYCNTGGTVSGRASHVGPNLAQVPKVKKGKTKVLDEITGMMIETEAVLKGRDGKHGWECRSLFTVPKGWTIVGADQAGIELRCLGAFTYEYDGGSLLEAVLNGDPHTKNQEAAGLPTRDHAKTFIYALIYGAGDIKLGSIVKPNASLAEQKKEGAALRSRFMKGMPGYAVGLKELKREWKRKGYITGMDGRRLYPRAEHSLLNIRLQHDAAILAKAWYILFVEEMERLGFYHGWDGDFAMLAWVHDELQVAVRDEHVPFVKHLIVKCAANAADRFGFIFNSPVGANADSGKTWADTH